MLELLNGNDPWVSGGVEESDWKAPFLQIGEGVAGSSPGAGSQGAAGWGRRFTSV